LTFGFLFQGIYSIPVEGERRGLLKMAINTCSGAISFAKELENESVRFYQNLAERFTKDKDLFLSFSKENGGYITQIERAYYGVISDAIEGCFAFNINPEEYALKTELVEKASYSEALGRAIEIEEKIIKFYSDAAEQSKSLMADVPRAFKLVAKKRSNRQSILKSLLGDKN
jgi:rubrerythrin